MTISLQTISRSGDDWLTARFDGADDAISLSAALQDAAGRLREGQGWLEVVPGLADLSVQFDPMDTSPTEAADRLGAALTELRAPGAGAAEETEIPVCYGGEYGPDLAHCASSLGMSEDEIISLHTGEAFLVQMMGFAPGFAYCGQTPAALAMERLAEPRARVAAGSVGIVGRQTCLYSLAGPGGWPLIGRTPLRLFDAVRDRPFLLAAGSRVRFRQISPDEFARLAEAG